MPSGKDILFFADTIFDIDIGVAELVKSKFITSEYINHEVAKEPVDHLKYWIVEKCHNNIMDKLLKKEYQSNSSSYNIYNDIIKNYYDKVIELSPVTGLINLLLLHKEAELNTGISPVVLCRSKLEEQRIKSYNINIETILVESDTDIKTIQLNRFTRIIVRRMEDIIKLNIGNLQAKSILVLSYRFNFEVTNSALLLEKYTIFPNINNYQAIMPYPDYVDTYNEPD